MAIALGNTLVSAGDTAASPNVTAALANAPGAGRLIIGFIGFAFGATPRLLSTVTGAGITTWGIHGTSISSETNASPSRSLQIVYAQQAAAGTTGAITITASGVTTGCCYHFFELTGTLQDFAGNGLAAFLQVVTAFSDTNVTTATGSNLATPVTDNALISSFQHSKSEVSTERTNWTEIADTNYLTPGNGLESQFTTTLETTYSASWATAAGFGALAAEIIAAPIAQPPRPRLLVPGFSRGGPPLLIAQQAVVIPATTSVSISVDTPGAITLTGQSVGLVTSLAADVGAVTLTGQAVGLVTSIGTVAGAVTLTGQVLGLKTSIGTVAGAVTLTGQTLGLNTSLGLVAGAVTWTGQTVGTGTPVTINIDTAGAITLTGQILGLKTSIGITAGAVTLTGQTVGLITSIGVTAGAVTLAGQVLGLKTQITPSIGAVTLTGQTLGLNTSIGIVSGAVTLTGQSIGLAVRITPALGSFTLTGQALGLATKITPISGSITFTGQAGTAGQVTTLTVSVSGAIIFTGKDCVIIVKGLDAMEQGRKAAQRGRLRQGPQYSHR